MVAVTNRINPDTSRTYTPASGSGTVTDVTNLPVTLGTVWEDPTTLKRYKFVLVEDAAVEVGDVVCYTTDDNGYEVTEDRSGGTSDNNQPAGLVVTAIADGDCGWIQTYGLSDAAITTDNAVAAGESLIPHASTDGGVDSFAPGSSDPATILGQALDADTGTSLAAGLVFLNCPKG